jgi:bloom syndrome protein
VSFSSNNFSDNLDSVVSYCQNEQVCRRVQQLAYFGEHVSASVCHGKCDVCAAGIVYESKDFTEEVKTLVLATEVRNRTE